jgi:hypothetical protein
MKDDLKKLEKIIKKIVRNRFRDATLDYTVQVSISSIEPGKVKYAALITSPSRHVQEIPFRFDSYQELEAALKLALKDFRYEDIEKAEVTSRINVYKNKITELEQYLGQIDKLGLDEDGFLNPDEDIANLGKENDTSKS